MSFQVVTACRSAAREKGHLVIFSERSKKITAEFVGLRAVDPIVRVAFGRGVGLVIGLR